MSTLIKVVNQKNALILSDLFQSIVSISTQDKTPFVKSLNKKRIKVEFNQNDIVVVRFTECSV